MTSVRSGNLSAATCWSFVELALVHVSHHNLVILVYYCIKLDINRPLNYTNTIETHYLFSLTLIYALLTLKQASQKQCYDR